MRTAASCCVLLRPAVHCGCHDGSPIPNDRSKYRDNICCGSHFHSIFVSFSPPFRPLNLTFFIFCAHLSPFSSPDCPWCPQFRPFFWHPNPFCLIYISFWPVYPLFKACQPTFFGFIFCIKCGILPQHVCVHCTRCALFHLAFLAIQEAQCLYLFAKKFWELK